ncbi:little elongation complex subunit 2 [Brienomyrus brachyistius]|uniref:little elongation complex subunit 2 n=1 Tax=Brienomyrus brachyistius TaxID=42636 RepID=UPI0020B2043A|nr:little elongation complex subunit 2 [Brienomyrus brachyistius]
MELIWDESPQNGVVGFSRDLYDKYTLAPNIKELWAIAQSALEVSSAGTTEVKKEKPAELATVTEEPSATNAKDSSDGDVYPEPRLPFPRLSSLTSKEQMLYLRMLMNLYPTNSFPQLQERVKSEVVEFMKYLQDVSRLCAEDYSYLCEGAARYVEEYLRASIAKVSSYPQLYHIHEMTSITGGKFNPDLSLNFEKQLLVLGKVNVIDVKKQLPKDIQLAVDYDTVASETPPDKKANQAHMDISCDANAEKLCARYKPHVCLSSATLLRLLDNHGPEYSEAWELPVWVKGATAASGSGSHKVVYVDSPLVKTEITQRERNTLFHEESVKLVLRKMSSQKALVLTLEQPSPSVPLEERCPRSLLSFDDPGISFEADFIDLETFGESSSSSKRTTSVRRKATAKQEVARSQMAAPQKRGASSRPAKGVLVQAESSQVVKEDDDSWMDLESSTVDCSLEKTELNVSGSGLDIPPVTKQPRQDGAEPTSLGRHASDSDSDEERLIIDQGPVSLKSPPRGTAAPADHGPATPWSPSPEMDGTTKPSPASPLPQGSTKSARRSEVKPRQNCDQVGQILRMQSALLKPSPTQAPEPMSPPPLAPNIPPSQSHPQSLVKPCVTSYLEAKESPGRRGDPAVMPTPAEAPTRLLPEDLLDVTEDELDYQEPKEGNLIYKMYSLQELLLLVRSSVPFARRTKLGRGPNKTVPVHVLAKLEYQVCYGVECFTKSELCVLWAEQLQHSSTSSYVGHINALTSKLFLTEEFTSERIKTASCEFRPATCLNVLHHLLEKLVSLSEGRYLVSHKAGEPIITIAKASDGRKSLRTMYNLHQAHGSLPQAPPHGAVPWVPVDPSHLLSFHVKHERVPCTFPPQESKPANSHGTQPAAGSATSTGGAGKPGAPPTGGTAKRKKKSKSARRSQKWREKRKLQQKGGVSAQRTPPAKSQGPAAKKQQLKT